MIDNLNIVNYSSVLPQKNDSPKSPKSNSQFVQFKPVDNYVTNNKKNDSNNTVKWIASFAISIAFVLAFATGINRMTRGGMSSIIGRAGKFVEKSFIGESSIYKAINRGFNNLGKKIKTLFNKLPQRYKNSMKDTEFGNRRKSKLSPGVYQVKNEFKSKIGNELYKTVESELKALRRSPEWKSKPDKVKPESVQNVIDGVLRKGNVRKDDSLNMLVDKYKLLQVSKDQSFVSKILSRGTLMLENIANTSTPITFTKEGLTKMALPLGFTLLNVPNIKETLDTKATVWQKISKISKDFIIGFGLGLTAFSIAGKMINSVTGLKTLGVARDELGNMQKNAGKLVKETIPSLKMKSYDKPFWFIGKVVGLGQSRNFSMQRGFLRGVRDGAWKLITGLGMRFFALTMPMESLMTKPAEKLWDLIFGKTVDPKEEQEAEKAAQKSASVPYNGPFSAFRPDLIPGMLRR